ncbi:MAG: FixH family protein [Lentisphaeraceae bacterium]|nr:FixH family protein [Lentisphaeraceae bacterium]
MKSYLLLLSLLIALFSCDAPQSPTSVLRGKSFELELSKAPAQFPLNELFEFSFKVNSDDKNLRIEVDAGMPSHGHGMNTTTKTKIISPGHYKVRGMQLHMEGEWLLSFDIYSGNQLKERIEHKFTL